MGNLKKYLFLIFALFLTYRLIELYRLIASSALETNSFYTALFLAFIMNLYATGIFAFISFSFSISKILPNKYYLPKYPDILYFAYKYLGLGLFKTFLMLFFWGKKKNRKKFFDGKKSGIQHLILKTKEAEIAHLFAFILINIFSIMLFYKGMVLIPLLGLPLNLFANFYPILLQRHHRMRLNNFVNIIVE